MLDVLVVERSRAGLSRRMTRISEGRKGRELISLMADIGFADRPAAGKTALRAEGGAGWFGRAA
jgi:hypothetical protein